MNRITALLLLALLPPPLRAQEATFPLERYRPATTSAGLLDVEWGGVGEHLQWDVAVHGNYAINPLVVYDGDTRVGALVAHRIGADFTGTVALFHWVELAADLPLVVFQAGATERLPASIGAADLSVVGVGDLRLAPKVRLLRAREQLVDLAVIPAVTLPTGLPPGQSYVGEGQLTFVPEIVVSRALGGLRLAGNAAFRVRPVDRTIRNVIVGDELLYRAGVGFRFHDVVDLPLELDVTVSGGTAASQPFSSGLEENPLELLVGARYDLLRVPASAGAGHALVVQGFLGGGAGLVAGVGTPDMRVLAGLRGFVPTDIDHDDDGRRDADDLCVDRPEDVDGFTDTDGCPDDDNDQDAHADVADRCPNEAEDVDGFMDADGCPEADNDGDGLRDRDDRCADAGGPADNGGCPWPDSDGDGVLDKDDACPAAAGLPALQGCPDGDGDGLVDGKDACPTLGGPAKLGGCPDSDDDGFTDDADRCTGEAETFNGAVDDDGCPDEGRVLVALTSSKIEMLERVSFAAGTATIQEQSFPLLDQVAALLRAHREIAKVRIEAHTDGQGDDQKNLALSHERALAVQAYLVGKGVDPARLVAQGVGETKPVADNGTAAGREQNRRVELILVE